MEQPEPNNKLQKFLTALGIVAVIAIIAIGVKLFVPKESGGGVSTATTTSSTSQTYKDGTYSATGEYTSPGGTEAITISLTLKNDIVTSTSAKQGAREQEGREFQADFIKGYKKLVVGKNISELKLSKVSGSSLTSLGFNDALQQIKTQAQ